MLWFTTSLNWYAYLFILGLICFPITSKLFSNFIDRGYAFSKTIAIIIISYLAFIFGIVKLLPFSQSTLFVIVTMLIFFNLYIFLSNRKNIIPRQTIGIIVFEELLFFIAFLFLLFIRGQEPSIRGLEKFMDFGFINSILRSAYFPPLDMWLSADSINPQGYPINYYYFGHLTGAALIKLINVKSSVGYNLILATIFAQAIVLVFSLTANTISFVQIHFFKKINSYFLILTGLIGSFIVNLGGNLHTIYLFTSGYQVDAPVLFLNILSSYNPAKYWYPNATRFIPYTIHEFPSYSYVVADLHGHVFDIPFVLLTLAVLFHFFISYSPPTKLKKTISYLLLATILGFLIAINYMTNAFDGFIYMIFAFGIIFMIGRFTKRFFIGIGTLIAAFFVFSYPFSYHFIPFASKIGLNCSPDFLVKIGKIGSFIFEKGNCQVSPLWMLFVLWGFFWFAYLLFIITIPSPQLAIDRFIFILFSFGMFLIFIPEFFYIKDIYPVHFRANTMFKLGYQAFIMMGIASAYVFFRIKIRSPSNIFFKTIALFLFILPFFFISFYPFISFPSYYGNLQKKPELDGSLWLNNQYKEDKEIIDYLNVKVKNQPVILEAQGDSYTDYERISAYTGLPTVGGWFVHEWLWRGSSDILGKRIPDIQALYESNDTEETKTLLKKYRIRYVVVSTFEKEKYKNMNEKKFEEIGKKIFVSANKKGALYQVNFDTY